MRMGIRSIKIQKSKKNQKKNQDHAFVYICVRFNTWSLTFLAMQQRYSKGHPSDIATNTKKEGMFSVFPTIKSRPSFLYIYDI